MSYKIKKWNDFEITEFNSLKEVKIISPSTYREFRGEIFTTYHTKYHPANDFLSSEMCVHDRFSRSYKGVLRGLHYDFSTWKLVQAVVGDIYLVVLDMRLNSATNGKWESYIITERTRDQVLIPPGFANGHFALTDCIFHYNLFYEGDYVDESEQKVVKWNDSKYNINWPTNSPILQKRDS